jgi:predicted amidohydrolase
MALRVAAVQAEAVPGEVSRNLATATRLADRAVAEGARLIVFPEAFATGYDVEVFAGPLPTLDDPAWLAPLQGVVDSAGVTVILNSAIEQAGRRTLTDIVLAPRVAPWAAYDKQHLHPPEVAVFCPGEHGASLRIDGAEVALSVCYDANFPEHAAAAATDGAIVYVNSGAYFPGGGHRRDLHYAARALDNGIYVVFAALIGAPSDFIGGTAIYDPLGVPLARLGDEEGVVVADIDTDLVARVRADQRMWADRRPSLGARTIRDI